MIINDDSLFCNFVQINKTTYECYKCGVTLVVEDEIPEPPLLPCSASFAQHSASDIRNYVSNTDNINNLCSEEEINRRHSICEGCEFFANNSCTECGCYLSRDRVYMNKLAMKDQSCPLNRW